jgi:hypothetical protein
VRAASRYLGRHRGTRPRGGLVRPGTTLLIAALLVLILGAAALQFAFKL